MDVSARYGWRGGEEVCLRDLCEQKDKWVEERQMADVCRWKRQACEIVVCAGGVQDSGEAAFFAGVVLVQLGFTHFHFAYGTCAYAKVRRPRKLLTRHHKSTRAAVGRGWCANDKAKGKARMRMRDTHAR